MRRPRIKLISPAHIFAGKAVATAPAIPGNRDYAPEIYGRSFLRMGSGKFGAQAAKRQLEAYGSSSDKAIDWVADAVGVIAETAAHADWHLEDQNGHVAPRTRADAEPNARLADPWLVQLLEEPNAYQSWEDLIELFVIDRFITGDGFLLKRGDDGQGRPLQLLRLAPQYVEAVGGEDGRLYAYYEYKTPGQVPVRIPPENVIHWKGPNPHDDLRGAGVIAMGPRVFDMEIALTDTQAAYFENGAHLGGVLEAEQAVSDSNAAKLRRQFAGIYGGAKQAFQVAVLGRGLKYSPIQSNAQEAEFGPMTNQSRERIFAMFRVPKILLGLPVESSSTTGPGEERRNFDNKRMRPILNTLQKLLSKELTADFGYQLKIDYEYQMPIEDQFKLAGEAAAAPGILVKEVRRMYNLKPLRDEIEDAVKATKIEETVLNLPDPANTKEGGTADRPLPGEAGRPPKGENVPNIEPRGGDF
jgi:HK97 family phage portal protein